MLEGGTGGQVSAGQCHPAGHMERVPCGVWQPEGLCVPWQRGPDPTVLGTGWNWSRWESRRAGGSRDTGSGVLSSAQKISNVSENTRIMESRVQPRPSTGLCPLVPHPHVSVANALGFVWLRLQLVFHSVCVLQLLGECWGTIVKFRVSLGTVADLQHLPGLPCFGIF